MFRVVLKSEIGLREKLRTIVGGLFPVWWVKRQIRRKAEALAKELAQSGEDNALKKNTAE